MAKRKSEKKKKLPDDKVAVSLKKEANTAKQISPNTHIDASEDNVHREAIDIADILPCRVNGVKEHSLSEETVLYSPESEVAHSLNSSARAIWELCDGTNSIVKISQILGKRLGCSGVDLISDVKTAINKFQKLSLLELKNASLTKST